MVLVPGSSGESGFHRESLSEEEKVKTKFGMEALEAKGSPTTRDFKGSPDYQSFGRGYDDMKIKEENRSIDLEDKSRPPPMAPLGPPRIVLQSTICWVKTNQRKLNKNYTRPLRQKKLSKKKTLKTGRVKKEEPRSDRHDRSKKNDRETDQVRGSGSGYEDGRLADGSMAQGSHWKALKYLLSSDPVLRILNFKLIGEIQGLISRPKVATNAVEGISAIIQLQQDAGYVAGAFDANELRECDQDQVIHTCRSLYDKLIPLTGKCESAD
uniref:Uncharacterized protein n=1 Tax=Peronospora matthiolae TaxID=2874970 RepID=A0AAV1TID1_9STRA